MKILHVHEVYHPYKGGSAIRIKNLIDAQKQLYVDHTIVVLTTKKSGLKNKYDLIDGIEVVVCNNLLLMQLEAYRLDLKYKFDLLHIHNTRFYWLMFPYLLMKNSVLEIHSYRQLSKKYKNILQDLALFYSKNIIVLSETNKKYFLNKFDRTKQYLTLRNGIDLKGIYKKEKNNKFENFIYYGSLYEWQGILIFLEVAKIAKSKNLNYQFTIVGDGPLKKDVLEYLNNNELSNSTYIDYIDRESLILLLHNYQHFLYLRPSRKETELTFPLKILEIAKLNLNLFITNRKAHIEIFDGKQNDFVNMVSDDPQKIINEIQEYLHDCNKLEEKRVRFSDFVESGKFSWKDSAELLVEYYKKIIRK